MMLQSLWRSVARSFASAFVIEVVSPKISGVTATETLKNLSSAQFIHSSYYIYDVIVDMLSHKDCVSIGETLLYLMSSVLRSPAISTNTCLGYGLTAISLASSILYSLRAGTCGSPEECALAGYEKFEYCAMKESPDDLIKSIRMANPSYHGYYYSPRTLSNVFELLLESALWDLVAYNVVNRYSVTLDLYNSARSTSVNELVRTIGKLYRYAAGKYLDSVSFKSGGIMLSRLVREIASSPMRDYEVRSVLVNKVGVNLGSISDLVASSIALVFMSREWGVLA